MSTLVVLLHLVAPAASGPHATGGFCGSLKSQRPPPVPVSVVGVTGAGSSLHPADENTMAPEHKSPSTNTYDNPLFIDSSTRQENKARAAKRSP